MSFPATPADLPPTPDPEAIAAIRGGDAERYRELIERYERRAYAIAWSRLGDPSLAEEATQEAFIRAYRHLDWLRDPARFGAWLLRIVRGVAINLGLRHRRELRRRERWALDQPAAVPAPESAADDPPVTAQTLRKALSDLPAGHRECLVLHYLEGRSVAEAAALVGVSEGAFKVRLHRARAALRRHLDSQLRHSLERLEPRHSLAPAIMAILPVAPATSAGAGLLAALGGGLSKLLPAPVALALLPILPAAAGVGLAAWQAREERRNFIDPSGFRADLHRRSARSALVTTAVILAVVALAFLEPVPLQEPIRGLHLLLALGIGLSLASLRLLRINRNPAMIAQTLAGLPLWIALLIHTVVRVPAEVFFAAQAVLFVAMAFGIQARPLRFDYNLFLRHWKAMLPTPASTPQPRPLTPRQILDFGQFLGTEWLIHAYRRHRDGYTFALTPVVQSAWRLAIPVVRRDASTLTLRTDGSLQARLGLVDQIALLDLKAPVATPPEPWEHTVTAALQASLDRFLAGEPAAALHCLGQTPSTEVFQVPPSRSRGMRLSQAFLVGVGLLTLGLLVHRVWTAPRPGAPVNPPRLTPPAPSVADIRKHLESLSLERDPASRAAWRTFYSALHEGVVLPPPDWLTSAGLQRVHSNLLSGALRAAVNTHDAVDRALGHPGLHRAVAFRWIRPSDLAPLGITPEAVRDTVASWPDEHRHRRLNLDAPSVQGHPWRVLDTESLYWRALFLDRLGCLDLLDARAIATTLAAHQLLPDRQRPDNRRPDLVAARWNGLFATHGWNPIRDTFHALALLDLLQSLDAIDRDACVDGILRFHRGAGRFAPERSGTEIILLGDARDTHHALESLRLLNALDRVPDLAHWVFRPRWTSNPDPHAGAPPTWQEIEAVLLGEQLRSRLIPDPTTSR